MIGGRRSAAIEAIRAAGGRVTAPRQAVLDAVLDADEHHFTASDIVAAIHHTKQPTDRATVYRTLELLTEIGLLDQLQLDSGAAVYHRADHPHGHLLCNECGSVEELPSEVLEDVVGRIASHAGFVVDTARVALSGACRACAAKAAVG
ncbi:MAG: ferric uptake regulator, Fur family [Acidimicrobiales bacterium]|nr:ferric uptake regulator, Fur family [Acidimicrobiales bacterium]